MKKSDILDSTLVVVGLGYVGLPLAISFAKKIKVDIKNINYTKNSFLHVMTQGYQTGGHTRVIERWIENAQNDQIHSVVLTNKNDSVLNTLQNNIKNSVQLYTIENSIKLGLFSKL